MKPRIPRSFKVLGRTFRVTLVAGLQDEEGTEVEGLSNYNEGWVKVNANADPESQLHTFYHELLHVFMAAAGRDTLYEDEGFVDLTGGLLHQFLSTSRGNAPTQPKA